MPVLAVCRAATCIAPMHPFKIGDTLIRVIRAPISENNGFDSLWYHLDSDVYFVTRFSLIEDSKALVLGKEYDVVLDAQTIREFEALKSHGIRQSFYEIELFHMDQIGGRWRGVPISNAAKNSVSWSSGNIKP